MCGLGMTEHLDLHKKERKSVDQAGLKSLLSDGLWREEVEGNKTGVFNDPLGQTHSLASSEHYSHLKIVLFCVILKSSNGQKYRHHTCENKLQAVTLGWPSGSKKVS